MTENKVVSLRPEGAIDDPLTEILRAGARSLIAQAVEAEFAAFLASHDDKALRDGRRRGGPARARPRPADSDRRRAGRGEEAEGARPQRGGGRRAHPLRLFDPSAMGAAGEEPRCASV